MSSTIGTLYIVATPIGNMQDITLRALETLQRADIILAEDTRHTGLLLQQYSIQKPMLSFHDHNETERSYEVIQKLKNGQNLALVSDAGTPLVSDPGYKLVRSCIEEGITVESIPGPSAAITALTVSGLPPDKFLFIGFLPQKPGKRQKLLASLIPFCHGSDADNELKTTIILYESPYRLQKTFVDMELVIGTIPLVVCRELTKIHEEVFRGTTKEAIDHFKNPKGEFVILF